MGANWWDEYARYHWAMDALGDIDPSYALLRYIADRFDLHPEQRYWLAFLYALTYCGPSAYYIYNEFPDLAQVDLGRLERWWHTRGRAATLFQTDRRWVRSRHQFVPAVASYLQVLGGRSQAFWFGQYRTPDPAVTYTSVEAAGQQIYQMGRFACFNWLEAVHVVTGFPMLPHTLDLAGAESCRNGLVLALGRPQLLTGAGTGRTGLPPHALALLQRHFQDLFQQMQAQAQGRRLDVWTLETVLCAYKKYRRGQRYPGYYLDRQAQEIAICQGAVPQGVHWDVLWDFRRETFRRDTLVEAGANNRDQMERRLAA